jgi:hypothetical protein
LAASGKARRVDLGGAAFGQAAAVVEPVDRTGEAARSFPR